jgi:hypothetical protein
MPRSVTNSPGTIGPSVKFALLGSVRAMQGTSGLAGSAIWSLVTKAESELTC